MNATARAAASDVRLTAALALGVAALTVALFAPACGDQFLSYDDGEYITDNAHVRLGLNADNARWALTTAAANNWHPLTWLALQLDAQLYGLNPGGFHLSNLLLHAANAALLLLLFHRMTGALWSSTLLAGLFAWHPLRVESVAWAAERKDVLCAFFGLLALDAYARYARRPALGRYGAVVLAFALGLAAKPMLITLPFVMLLLDFWPLGRAYGQAKAGRGAVRPLLAPRLLEKVPHLQLAAACAVLTLDAQESGGAVKSLERFPLTVRLANAVVAYVEYLHKAVWPARLAVFYPHPGSSLPLVQVACAVLFLVLMTAWVLRAARRCPYLPVGWLWYLGMLVPVIGFVQAGLQEVADRYTYLPLVGVFVMLAWGLADLVAGRPLATALAVLASLAALSACAAATADQLAYWRDDVHLWQRAVSVTSRADLAHYNLGVALATHGQRDEAAKQYLEALEINPRHAEAANNLGVIRYQQGRFDEARRLFEQALRARPHYRDAELNLARLPPRPLANRSPHH
jgi:tetratricopeptide (TPR) repeat protein